MERYRFTGPVVTTTYATVCMTWTRHNRRATATACEIMRATLRWGLWATLVATFGAN